MEDQLLELQRQVIEAADMLAEAERDGTVDLSARVAFERQVELALIEAMRVGVRMASELEKSN